MTVSGKRGNFIAGRCGPSAVKQRMLMIGGEFWSQGEAIGCRCVFNVKYEDVGDAEIREMVMIW